MPQAEIPHGGIRVMEFTALTAWMDRVDAAQQRECPRLPPSCTTCTALLCRSTSMARRTIKDEPSVCKCNMPQGGISLAFGCPMSYAMGRMDVGSSAERLCVTLQDHNERDCC